jgi:hypothetical protein
VVLEGFLTVLLKTNVKIHRMLESEGNQEHEHSKFNRVDMIAELGSGELAIVEVQNYTTIADLFPSPPRGRVAWGDGLEVTAVEKS